MLPVFVMPAGAQPEKPLLFTVEGVDSETVDSMALDPQSWRLPHDTRYNAVPSQGVVITEDTKNPWMIESRPEWDDYESYVPHPLVDWERYNIEGEDYVKIEHHAGARVRTFRVAIIMVEFPDKPMVSSLPQGSDFLGQPLVDTGVAGLKGEERAQALRDFWNQHFNIRVPDMNRGHTFSAGWLEYSNGMHRLEADIYGPVMLSHFSFQYSGMFWNRTSSTNFGDYYFSAQFPQAPLALRNAAAARVISDGFPIFDRNGVSNYDMTFYKVAGNCQSPTWQETGSMMFQSPYLDAQGNPINTLIHNGLNFGFAPSGPIASVRPIIAMTDDVAHPISREYIEGVRGMDLTGYAAIQRIKDTVTAEGFDITVEWPDFYMSNVEELWRTHVSTGTNQTAFTTARTAWENANLTAYYAQFRLDYPGTTRPDTWIRDNYARPFFLAQYAEGLKTSNVAMYETFKANNNHEAILGRLVPLLDAAMLAAATNERNPYFQAAPSRYVPWTAWYSGNNVWSSAGSNSFETPWGTRSFAGSIVTEGSNVSGYSHELGHLLGLPDNDNAIYGTIPLRTFNGPWCNMARGAHPGYYGGHTRWYIPGVGAGSVGVGLMARWRIGIGYTDLTNPLASNASLSANHKIRDDFQNSQDIKYVPYSEFLEGPPIIAEIYGRNVPTNRGLTDAKGNPIKGYTGLIIEPTQADNARGIRFRDRTPRMESNGMAAPMNAPIFGTATGNTISSRWGTQLLGVPVNNPVLTTDAQRNALLNTLPTDDHGRRIIDPARWNWFIGGDLGGTGGLTAYSPALTGRQHGFSIDVIDRTGADSFNIDHGVLISRINNVGSRAGGFDSGGSFIVDSHPGRNNFVQYREADGRPYMMACDHHAQIGTAAFHAGVHNDATYYRQILGSDGVLRNDPFGRFLPNDPRPGYAGNTVNEWVDEYNEAHFYILQRNDYEGKYGPFISYDVAARSTAAGAWKADGALVLKEGAPILPAKVGKFSKQTYSLTNTGTATDIVRIVLGGTLAKPVMISGLGGDKVFPGYENVTDYLGSTKDQNAILLNNLYAVGAGETIEFDVWVRNVDGKAKALDLTVTAVSETNVAKSAKAGLTVVVDASTSAYVVKKNGNKNDLYITVKEFYSDGTSKAVEKLFVIDNNAEGYYVVEAVGGAYRLFVDTKGNTQIRANRFEAWWQK